MLLSATGALRGGHPFFLPRSRGFDRLRERDECQDLETKILMPPETNQILILNLSIPFPGWVVFHIRLSPGNALSHQCIA